MCHSSQHCNISIRATFFSVSNEFIKFLLSEACIKNSVHRGGAWVVGEHAWWGACVGCQSRGMCGCQRGTYMVAGGHVWLLGDMCGCRGGMRGCGEHAWLGVCMVVGGCVWLYGGVHGWGGHAWLLSGVCMVAGGCIGYNEIRSMSGRYASYWNAFLCFCYFQFIFPGRQGCVLRIYLVF